MRRFRKKDFLKTKREVPKKVPKKTHHQTVVINKPPVKQEQRNPEIAPLKESPRKPGIKGIYETNYKALIFIPVIILLLALFQIGFQTVSTGDFVKKGISLSGGISLTVQTEKEIDIIDLQDKISQSYPNNEINVRSISDTSGSLKGFIVEANVDGSDADSVNLFIDRVMEHHEMTKDDYSLEVMGSALGKSFFTETIRILIVAFLSMAMVVFLLFGEKVSYKILSGFLTMISAILIMFFNNKTLDIIAYAIGIFLIYTYIRRSIPSIAVILAAFSDIIVTLAVFNLLNQKLTTAGVAAFLMLIGYSVDSDILLSTKVLKTKHGSVDSRVYEAMKTALMMNLTTLIAVLLAFIFTDSETIKQIMLILIIGLLTDLIYTWLQNVGLLKLYMKKNE